MLGRESMTGFYMVGCCDERKGREGMTGHYMVKHCDERQGREESREEGQAEGAPVSGTRGRALVWAPVPGECPECSGYLVVHSRSWEVGRCRKDEEVSSSELVWSGRGVGRSGPGQELSENRAKYLVLVKLRVGVSLVYLRGAVGGAGLGVGWEGPGAREGGEVGVVLGRVCRGGGQGGGDQEGLEGGGRTGDDMRRIGRGEM